MRFISVKQRRAVSCVSNANGPYGMLRLCCMLGAALMFGPRPAGAQTPPDAGSLLQQIERQQQPALPPKAAPQFQAPVPLQSLGGETVTVTSFNFAGNELLSAKQLAPVVESFRNRPLDFTQLQNAAVAVAAAYRRAGWVVRVYLPQQDITSGAVTIQIVEAKFGVVRVEGKGERVYAEQLQRIVEDAQAPGAAVSANALDRGLLLIGEVPGVVATGRLDQGQNQAETDLVVSAAAGALLQGSVSADNEGERATGAGRLLADVSLNSPLYIGDRLEATLLGSQGSNYERLDYSVPVGSGGWRIGVNGAHLDYRVITADFAALDAHGTSTTAGLEASYPLVRSRLQNLYLSLNLDNKRFDNDSAGATATQYTIRDASVGLYGNLFDSLGGSGANNASVTLQQGEDDLAGSPNEGADSLTTHVAGSFQKLRFSLSRLQAVTDFLSLYAGLSGQAASKNLDSSEKFYLGGADGVRAYPMNEGGGAEGLLLNLEAREPLPASFNLTEFFDWGRVHVNEKNDIAGAAVPNIDSLKGVGMAVSWRASFGLTLSAIYAHRIGSNPDPTSTGQDQDGSHIDNRVWLQASMPY
jgi:hemolysin activation/secretion protein